MSCQQYHIQTTDGDHSAMLCSTVMAWTEREADMYLVSEEGCKIYTHRILISFYSSMVSDILKYFPTDMMGISVPVSSVSLFKMVKVLTTGTVIAAEKMNLMEVGLAAELIGIGMKNIQIGCQMKGVDRACKTERLKMNVVDVMSALAPIVADDIIESSMEESSGEFIIDGTAELDYPGEGANLLEVSLSEVIDSPMKKEKKRNKIKSSVHVGNKSKKDLAKHIKTNHLEEKPKPFRCETCDKGFCYSSSLFSHKLLHTAGKSFKCEFCEFASAQKGNLRSHKLRLHKDSK